NPEFQSLLTLDPSKIVPNVRQPLLIVQGELDAQVEPPNADRLKELADKRKKAPPTEVVKLPGINNVLVPAKTGDVHEEATRAATPGLVSTTGPRYFGVVTGGALPATVAAEWLASAWDQNAALYVMSPVASVVEEVAGVWLLDVLGLPRHASVSFVTGCHMA